jgi:hypothetical protein
MSLTVVSIVDLLLVFADVWGVPYRRRECRGVFGSTTINEAPKLSRRRLANHFAAETTIQ